MSPKRQPTGFSQLVAELRRRRVVRFSLGYAAAAFVVLQLAEIVFPAFGIGEGGLRALVVATGLSFIPALALAWVYDITTEGIKRTEDGGLPAEGTPSRLALSGLLVLSVLITGGLGLYLANQGVLSPTEGAGEVRAGEVRTAAYDPSVPIRSLAVLPLDDFSPSGDQAYFTAGMHEELIAKLSMIEDVRVVSRTTVMRYSSGGDRPASPQIGQELGVDALIEGSVTRGANQVRVTLQIIHAPSDSHIATLQWERENLDDVLAFQTEIARAVVDSILGDHDQTALDGVTVASVDPEAQEAYLRARHEYDRGTSDGYRMALEYFEDALAEDPEFAAAMTGAAGARFLVGLDTPEESAEALAQAREEAVKGLAMDSTSMEAKEVLSFIERGMPKVMGEIVVERPLTGSGAFVVTMPGTFDSVEVDMGAFDTAWVAATTGLGQRIDEQMRRRFGSRESDAEDRQALEARRLMSSGRYVEAALVLESVVEGSPEMAPAWDMLARSRVAAGNVTAATDVMAAWQESGASGAPDQGWVERLRDAVEVEGEQGYWSWTLDRLTMYESEGRPIPRVEIATAHAALGQDEEAFRYLSEALAGGEPGILSLRSDPVWDDLRRDPRFRAVVRQAQSMRFSQRPPRDPGRRR